MAYLMRVCCCGCPYVCPAVPLTGEYLLRLMHENRELFEKIVYLRSISVYCIRGSTYKFFELP